MLSPSDRQDKLIKATDLDALSCRQSINSLSYLIPKDEFISDFVKTYESYLQFCLGYSQLSASRTLRSTFSTKKFPLINRGSYLRTIAIDQVIYKFVEEHHQNCQIVSLGCGSDTRVFHLLKKFPKIIYHEVDFPESLKIKKLAILENETLCELLKCTEKPPSITSKEEFREFSSNLSTPNYHLHGIDLRMLNSSASVSNFNNKLPTLVISECALCYLSPEEYVRNINYWKTLSENLTCFLIYEPMSLNDSFGETMTQNLMSRGINLKLFDKYPDLKARKSFLKINCGLTNMKLTTLSNIGGYDDVHSSENTWISRKERQRISTLEFIDEIEEIKLLLEHYCLCYGEFKKTKEIGSFKGINHWFWTES